MAITTLSMVLTVMVLNLHSISERPVPRWVKILVLKHLARLFCLSPLSDAEINAGREPKLGHSTHLPHHNGRRLPKTARSVSMASALDDDIEEHVPIIAINGGPSSAHSHGQETSFVQMRTSPYFRNNNASNKLLQYNNKPTEEEEEKPPDYSKEWHKLAEVVDRLFFWTFLLMIVAISILLFHPLTKEYLNKEEETPP